MNHLILVKHSLPEIVSTLPASQWKLSRSGHIRCKALAEKIKPYFSDVIISSLEPKAVETAQNLARQIDKPVHALEGLHEHDRTGVAYLDRQQFEDKIRAFFRHPGQLVFGQETADQARERFSKALASIEMKYANKTLAVVSHGTVITLLVEKATGLEPFSFWKRLDLPSFVVLSLPGYELVTIVESVV